jgi:hypothetical protein
VVATTFISDAVREPHAIISAMVKFVGSGVRGEAAPARPFGSQSLARRAGSRHSRPSAGERLRQSQRAFSATHAQFRYWADSSSEQSEAWMFGSLRLDS